MGSAQYHLLPTPQYIENQDGNWQPSGVITIISDTACAPDEIVLEWLRGALRQSYSAQVAISSQPPQQKATNQIILRLSHSEQTTCGKRPVIFNAAMQDEGYALSITSAGAEIVACRLRGVFYGLMTLLQLIETSAGAPLPGLFIIDYPALKIRSVSDDISRGQVSTIDNFKSILQFLARHKYNTYMPYIEDVIQIEKYPQIGQHRGALTSAEIRELQQYARRCQIEIIPIFQTLGHFENILNHPDFVRFAEFPGAAALNTLSAESDRFLFDLLADVVPQFDSPFFHMGADESWDVGLGATRETAQTIGIPKLHADHYNKVYRYLRDRDKTVMMYGDIILRHPENMARIPKDIIIVDWHYWSTDQYPSVRQFRQGGFDVLVSPGLQNWNTPLPDFNTSWMNIYYLHQEGHSNGALGTVVSSWNDYGAPNFRELNYLGYLYGIETAWNRHADSQRHVNEYFFNAIFNFTDSRLHSLLLHLNEIPNVTNFKQIWEHPFYETSQNTRDLIERSQQLLMHSQAALDIITEIRPQVTRNSGLLDYYIHAAHCGLYMGHKIDLNRYYRLVKSDLDSARLADEQRLEFIRRCDDQVARLLELESEFRQLWLRTNRPDNIDLIINQFRRQAAYYSDARDEVGDRFRPITAELPSRWIFTGDEKPNSRIQPVYLKKNFTISHSSRLKFADLQLLANNDATIYLNGETVGRIIATKSLSLAVERQKVGWWDVKQLLRSGENVLAVEVQGYKPGWPSMANVYLSLEWEDGSQLVIASDSTWLASNKTGNNWLRAGDQSSGWKNARVLINYRWKIATPMFRHGFASQVEF